MSLGLCEKRSMLLIYYENLSSLPIQNAPFTNECHRMQEKMLKSTRLNLETARTALKTQSRQKILRRKR